MYDVRREWILKAASIARSICRVGFGMFKKRERERLFRDCRAGRSDRRIRCGPHERKGALMRGIDPNEHAWIW